MPAVMLASGYEIPAGCRTVVIGSSMVKDIDSERLGMSSYVIALNGAHISDVNNCVCTLPTWNCEGVRNVVLHVGSNDCKTAPTKSLTEDMNLLITSLKKVFVNGKITVSSCLPRRGKLNYVNNNIAQLNVNWRDVCSMRDLGYIDNDTAFSDNKGVPYKQLYSGLTHLSPRGSGRLAMAIIRHLRPSRQAQQGSHASAKRGREVQSPPPRRPPPSRGRVLRNIPVTGNEQSNDRTITSTRTGQVLDSHRSGPVSDYQQQSTCSGPVAHNQPEAYASGPHHDPRGAMQTQQIAHQGPIALPSVWNNVRNHVPIPTSAHQTPPPAYTWPPHPPTTSGHQQSHFQQQHYMPWYGNGAGSWTVAPPPAAPWLNFGQPTYPLGHASDVWRGYRLRQ